MEMIMKLFKRKSKEPEREELSPNQKQAKEHAVMFHKKRIANLEEELVKISSELETSELDVSLTKNAREKLSDTAIRRMSIIKYEIEIREGLIKWLS